MMSLFNSVSNRKKALSCGRLLSVCMYWLTQLTQLFPEVRSPPNPRGHENLRVPYHRNNKAAWQVGDIMTRHVNKWVTHIQNGQCWTCDSNIHSAVHMNNITVVVNQEINHFFRSDEGDPVRVWSAGSQPQVSSCSTHLCFCFDSACVPGFRPRVTLCLPSLSFNTLTSLVMTVDSFTPTKVPNVRYELSDSPACNHDRRAAALTPEVKYDVLTRLHIM